MKYLDLIKESLDISETTCISKKARELNMSHWRLRRFLILDGNSTKTLLKILESIPEKEHFKIKFWFALETSGVFTEKELKDIEENYEGG